MTRFVWLRQFEPGSNSADANRLLDRREHLRRLDVPEGLFHDIPAHRITRLRRQGERYFADGLRELGGAPDVIGDALVVNGQPLTIVGVAPAGFEGRSACAAFTPTVGASLGRPARRRGPGPARLSQ